MIEELTELRPEWAKYVILDDHGEVIRELREPIKAAERAVADIAQQVEMEPWTKSFAAKALARDAVVAADMEAAFSVTSLFEPLVWGLDANPDSAGRTALGILVPEVGQLPWEAIADTESMQAARMPGENFESLRSVRLQLGRTTPLSSRQKFSDLSLTIYSRQSRTFRGAW